MFVEAWAIVDKQGRILRLREDPPAGVATGIERLVHLTNESEADALRARVTELEAIERRALHFIDTGFRQPFDHIDGCLFKADKRMPCQCDLYGRIRGFRDAALAFFDERTKATASDERRESAGEGR